MNKVVDSPQAGIGTARCLKEAGLRIIGVDDTSLVTPNPDLFEKVFCWEELRTMNFDALIRKLIDVKKIYGLDYLFPCYNETAILFSFIKDKLDFLKIKLIAPPKQTIKSLRKSNLASLIKTGDKYTAPKAKVFNNIQGAAIFAQSLGYPVVGKGLVKGAYISKNKDDLKQNIKKLADIWNNGEISCLVEEYISGKYVNCIVAINENKIVGYVEMAKIGLDQKGKYFIYEINPRSPAWIYAPCLLGLNLPKLVTSPISEIVSFASKEGFFGRETKHFIRQDNGATWFGKIKKSRELFSLAKQLVESLDFDTSIIEIETIERVGGCEDRLGFYSKGAVYKSKDLKYPSDLLF